MTNSNHSDNFFNLVHIKPKVFLTFVGSTDATFNKAYFTLRNISSLPILYRVVQPKSDTITLKARPQRNLILSQHVQRVQIFNDSESKPTLDHSIRIEVIIYDKDVSRWTAVDNPDESILFHKQHVEYYRYLCTFTRELHVLQFHEQLIELEDRMSALEYHVYDFCASDQAKRAWVGSFVLMLGQLINPVLQLIHSFVSITWVRMQILALPYRIWKLVQSAIRLI